MLSRSARRVPVATLFTARVVYAFSWYNVGAVLPLIGSSLGAGPEALGLVLASFLVGAGLFQVPAGIAAIRWGSRRLSLVGLTVMGLACTLSGLSHSWPELAATRFVAGVGAACFFSPALSLVASYSPPGERGLVIGLYNGGFSVGAAVGLAGGAWIGVLWGWTATLSLGGVALLAAALICAVTLPPEVPPTGFRSLPSVLAQSKRVLRSRSIWAVSLALTGFWAAIFIVAQYFVDYAGASEPAWGLTLAAALVTLVILVSFPAGPLGGVLGERSRHRVGLLAGLGLMTGVLVVLIPYLPLAALTVDFVGLGVLDGAGFAVLYLIPTYLPESREGSLALGVAVINSIQVGLGSLIAGGFGFLVVVWGYSASWWVAGLLAIAFLPLLLLVSSAASAPAGSIPSESPGAGEPAA